MHLVMMFPEEQRPLVVVGGGVVEPVHRLHLGPGRRRRRDRPLRHFERAPSPPRRIFICKSVILLPDDIDSAVTSVTVAQ